MHAWTLLGGLSAIGGVALGHVSTIEPDNFNITSALKDLGVDILKIPALQSLSSIQSRSREKSCSIACASLSFLFGSKVSTQNTTGYNNFTGSFWSVQQEEVQPHCVFRPVVNTEVSAAVLLSRLTGCEFAARSGGHAAFTGASSRPGGISIWFRDMNKVTLNRDKSVASIGPGNNWLSVYSALEPYGPLPSEVVLLASVLVDSFWVAAPLITLTCMDGLVVTANGLIVTASDSSFSDLYWALRGGGNNFGLVTKYNLYTIPPPLMRGGARSFLRSSVTGSESGFSEVINAFINVVNNASVDGHAQQYVAFLQIGGMDLASAELTYTKNVTDPEIFKQYRSIPAASDVTSTKSLVEYVKYLELENPFGLREAYWPLAFQFDEEFSNWVVTLFYSIIPQVANVAGAQPVLVYQGITEPMLNNMKNHGGSALGLDGSNGPVHLMHAACWWTNKDDDEASYSFVNSFWEQVVAKAKAAGVYNEYIYMNYASMFQDPISSYGDLNKALLNNIAKKYDPKKVYQTLQPGYFKLGGAPVTGAF
ncbi:FAD linked oxidase N-terminal [Penicillium canescens]|nr:FAD linked oxidase N-terminal [Penicillium canescens]